MFLQVGIGMPGLRAVVLLVLLQNFLCPVGGWAIQENNIRLRGGQHSVLRSFRQAVAPVATSTPSGKEMHRVIYKKQQQKTPINVQVSYPPYSESCACTKVKFEILSAAIRRAASM